MKLFAKKSLGQHFLNSSHVLEQIISAAAVKKDETVLEIGPGTGILTETLLKTGAKVISIEKDSRVIEQLRNKFKEFSNFKLIEGDVLETDPANLGLEDKEYALIANIPYYITGAILEKFLENSPRPNRMILLVQKEVAERILARDGKESILSISVKSFAVPRIIAKVSKGAFSPPPKVDSAILAIENISNKAFIDAGISPKKFFGAVRAGFAHKRKYLIRNLETILPKSSLETCWNRLELDPKLRAEDLSFRKWFEIAKCE